MISAASAASHAAEKTRCGTIYCYTGLERMRI